MTVVQIHLRDHLVFADIGMFYRCTPGLGVTDIVVIAPKSLHTDDHVDETQT